MQDGNIRIKYLHVVCVISFTKCIDLNNKQFSIFFFQTFLYDKIPIKRIIWIVPNSRILKISDLIYNTIILFAYNYIAYFF